MWIPVLLIEIRKVSHKLNIGPQIKNKINIRTFILLFNYYKDIKIIQNGGTITKKDIFGYNQACK